MCIIILRNVMSPHSLTATFTPLLRLQETLTHYQSNMSYGLCLSPLLPTVRGHSLCPCHTSWAFFVFIP